MKILVLIPTYNERENIEPLLHGLFALPLDLEALVVDDLSPDGTGEIVERLKAEYPGRWKLHRRAPAALGEGGIAAFQAAAGRDRNRLGGRK
jgi:dolichol-phosphate mannosyltransferase